MDKSKQLPDANHVQQAKTQILLIHTAYTQPPITILQSQPGLHQLLKAFLQHPAHLPHTNHTTVAAKPVDKELSKTIQDQDAPQFQHTTITHTL